MFIYKKKFVKKSTKNINFVKKEAKKAKKKHFFLFFRTQHLSFYPSIHRAAIFIQR
jgi:hypothetical protein